MVGYRTHSIALEGDRKQRRQHFVPKLCVGFRLTRFCWRSFDAELHIVIVKDRKIGKDLMLLPLVRRRAQLLQFLEIPDFSVSDYNSPIISRSIVADKT